MTTTLHQQIMIQAGNKKLTAELTIPPGADAIILFARSGIDAHLNSRDRAAALQLQKAGFGTLLSDLLTETEVVASKEFDIDLLTARLLIVSKWLIHRDLFSHYKLGYFAVSFAAAAAIKAAVCLEEQIGAVVCRAGRTDLAADVLPELQAPTLLVVGSLDLPILHLNREALDSLSCIKQFEVIQGTTHLFQGDKVNQVAALAVSWFKQHLHPAIIGNYQNSTI